MLKSRLLGAVCALAMSSGVAAAADLAYKVAPAPVPVVIAAYTWSGVYVGAHAGYGWSHDFWKGYPGGPNGEGFVGGLHAGVNWQSGALVLGLETSWDFTDITASKACVAGVISCRSDHQWAADARGRIGFAFDRFLVFGAAGIAATDFEGKANNKTISKTHVGWTAGLGVEYAVTSNMILGVEWKYADYGSDSYKFGNFGLPISKSAKIDVESNTVQFRASYKF